jgi:hypothetical protein
MTSMPGNGQTIRRKPSAIMMVFVIVRQGAGCSHSAGGVSPDRREVKPGWHQLYGLIPLDAGLLLLAQLIPEASLWPVIAQCAAVLAIFGAMAAWVRSNRSALGCSSDQTGTTSRG